MNRCPDGLKAVMELLASGEWMDGFDPGISETLEQTEDACFRLNSLPPSAKKEREEIIRSIFGRIGSRFTVHSPLRCDFGFNISVGENFVSNFNLTILDEAPVRIGDNVFIGPNTTICTVVHAMDARRRNAGIMKALPVRIGDNVWIAADVTILPGVTIGNGAVVGAGSVVTKNVLPSTIVAGNPVRVIRSLD